MERPFTANANKDDVACHRKLLESIHDENSKTNFDSGGYVQLW